jgi:hypothetical protein
VLRIKEEACQRMLTMLWKKERNLLEDDDGVEDGNEDVREDLQEHKLQPQYVHSHVRRVLKREGSESI